MSDRPRLRWEAYWTWPLKYWRLSFFKDCEEVTALVIGPLELNVRYE